MKTKRWLLVVMAVLTLLCTMPNVALATDTGGGDTAPVVSEPVTVDPAPAVEDPVPVVEDPAPAVEDPAPVVEDPAPAAEDPAPAAEDPAPASNEVVMSAPVMLMAAPAAQAVLENASVTISTRTSDGSPLSGVSIQGGNMGGSIRNFGSTGADGTLTISVEPGQYRLTASINGTSLTKTDLTLEGSVGVSFETSEARIAVADSNGTPISGASLQYKAGSSTYNFPSTGVDGIATKQLFAGTYDFVAGYLGTSSGSAPVNISGGGVDKTFATTEARIEVKGSNGAPISGASLQYKAGSSTYNFTSTGADGIATKQLFAGTYDFVAGYLGTSSGSATVDISGSGVDKTFTTTEAKIEVVDTSGNLLNGVSLQYKAGSSTYNFPSTGSDGIAVKELFAGTYDFVAGYRGTSSGFAPVDITNSGVDATFTATLVTLNFPGSIQYKAGSSTYNFNKPAMAMFPGTYLFTFSGSGKPTVTQELTIEGTPYNVNLAVVSLKDSNGNGLSGGVVSYYSGAWVSNVATTNASGLALLQLPSGKDATSVTLRYKGGSIQINQSMSSNPYYSFQTKKVTFKLLSSTGTPLAGTSSYYGGSWMSFGDNAEGITNSTMEMLPTKYSFSVTYAGAKQQQDNVDISSVSEVVFTTTKVTFKLLDSKGNDLAGSASYYAGGWNTFGGGTTTATMEMLPVKYSFAVTYGGSRQQLDNIDVSVNPVVIFQTGSVLLHYAGGTLAYYNSGWHDYSGAVEMLPVSTYFELKKSGFPTQKFYITPVAGQTYEKTIVCVRLVSSTGAGLSGGDAKVYNGGWSALGTTGADGVYFGLLEGNQAKSLTFGMTYGGGYVQKAQNLASDSFVVFQTKGVVFKLLSSTGAELEGDAAYYAGGWKTFADGKTTGTMEMLPASYTFGVTYAGGYVQKSQDVAADPVVVFRTVPVSFNLVSSTGEALEGDAKYYAGGWKTFGTGKTPNTMELLPISYTFGVTYLGGYVQKTQDVSTDANVVFQTKPVTFTLKSSKGTMLEGDATYYAGGWKTFGDGKTPETMEMLPVSYTFGVTYQGGYMQKSQNVAENANVVFETVPVSFKLLSSLGLPLKGEASYYAGGWRTFGGGQTSGTMELLPVSYTFKVGYLGASIQKTQNVATNAKVVFNTKLVSVNLYAKTKLFGRTVNVPVLGPIGGDVSFYAGGWKDAGKTLVLKEMLPTSYTFAVSFMGERQQLVQDVSSNTSVNFYTTPEKLAAALKQALK